MTAHACAGFDLLCDPGDVCQIVFVLKARVIGVEVGRRICRVVRALTANDVAVSVILKVPPRLGAARDRYLRANLPIRPLTICLPLNRRLA